VTGKKAVDFKSEELLSEYTLTEDKTFPRDHPLAGSLLRFLFRHILSPERDTLCPPRLASMK